MTELLSQSTEASATPFDLDCLYRPFAPSTLLTGVQAITRLLVGHRALDRRRGLRTASFMSGYQGSPLGGLDRLLAGMRRVLDDDRSTGDRSRSRLPRSSTGPVPRG
ncbi:hypothetical protein [Actinomadura geliboluensis]